MRGASWRTSKPAARRALEVLPSAEDIWDPLAFVAAVIEIEHRGDGIDADAVNMEFAQQIERTRQQEVGDFAATGETLYHLYGDASAADSQRLRAAIAMGPELDR